MSEGDDARAFRVGVDSGELYIAPQQLSWKTAAHGMYADIPIEGVPSGVRLIVRVRFNQRPGSYSVNVLWDGVRLYGFDIDGSPHPNARGLSIRPPHRQWIREDGSKDAEAVNVMQCGITSCQRALQYVLDWCGFVHGPEWTDPPPLQRNTSNTSARVHKGKGGRGR